MDNSENWSKKVMKSNFVIQIFMNAIVRVDMLNGGFRLIIILWDCKTFILFYWQTVKYSNLESERNYFKQR